jgi:hypothetical protein
MTDLKTAAQQALEFCEFLWRDVPLNDYSEDMRQDVESALRAALAEHDKNLAWFKERKANWDLQRKLAEETQERDRQRREYEEQRLAALAEPCPCGDRSAAECPGEWEPGCDLGNNPKYAKRVNLAEPVQEPYWYATPDGKYLSSNEVREWMDPKTKALHLEPPQWRKEELIPLYTHPPK